MSKRFENEYTRSNRDTYSSKEELQWLELEKKIGSETVECRTGVCKYKKSVFSMWDKITTYIPYMNSKTRKDS